ncbi:MAG: hypothetical protein ACMG55_16265 [Microcoleus sp.]
MRYTKPIILVTALVVTLFLGAGIANARGFDSFRAANNTTVTKSEVVNSTLFAAGSNIDISGEVNGDVFCAGQTITITGIIHGDVMCAGQTIRVAGQVDGSVRLAGQLVNLGGKVDGSASLAGQKVTLEGDSVVTRDVSSAASSSIFNGSVGRDLFIGSSEATVAGPVGRDVNGYVDNLAFTKSANVKGNVSYTSVNNANVASGAQIAGQQTRQQPPADMQNRSARSDFAFGVYSLITFVVIAMVLVLFAPRLFQSLIERGVKSPGKTALVGLVSLIIAPIVIIAAMLTIIGIPLGLLLGLGWLLVVILSAPVTAFYLGHMLLPSNKRTLLTMLLGSLVLSILFMIPIISFFAVVASALLGTGMIVSAVMQGLPKPVYRLK